MPLQAAINAIWIASMTLSDRVTPSDPKTFVSAAMIDLLSLCDHQHPTVSRAAQRAAQRFGIMGEV